MENKINLILTSEQQSKLTELLEASRSVVSFRYSCTAEEKREMQSVGDARLAFITKTADLTARRVDFTRRSFDPQALQNDVLLLGQLRGYAADLRAFVTEVEDTLARVGAEAYAASLEVYEDARKSKDASLKSDVEDLGKLFAKAGGSKPGEGSGTPSDAG